MWRCIVPSSDFRGKGLFVLFNYLASDCNLGLGVVRPLVGRVGGGEAHLAEDGGHQLVEHTVAPELVLDELVAVVLLKGEERRTYSTLRNHLC